MKKIKSILEITTDTALNRSIVESQLDLIETKEDIYFSYFDTYSLAEDLLNITNNYTSIYFDAYDVTLHLKLKDLKVVYILLDGKNHKINKKGWDLI